mmetsp:Transcript_43044/g.136821  ORF Transcript_43044/g.136821 Transcript_43044/m.136821 type:complete len:241 (+) Transcript_43044:42-764(+)
MPTDVHLRLTTSLHFQAQRRRATDVGKVASCLLAVPPAAPREHGAVRQPHHRVLIASGHLDGVALERHDSRLGRAAPRQSQLPGTVLAEGDNLAVAPEHDAVRVARGHAGRGAAHVHASAGRQLLAAVGAWHPPLAAVIAAARPDVALLRNKQRVGVAAVRRGHARGRQALHTPGSWHDVVARSVRSVPRGPGAALAVRVGAETEQAATARKGQRVVVACRATHDAALGRGRGDRREGRM